MNMTLNYPMIKKLIAKDWYLTRKIIAIYLVAGIFALSFISLGEWQFYMGAVLLITALIGLSNHQISITIIQERKEQTLPFIMSLPISPMDYLIAKLVANMTIFIIPWLILLAGSIVVILTTSIPDGLVPFTVIICVLMLVNYCITWSTGMAVASEGATISIMISLNCLINPFFFVFSKTPSIATYIHTNNIVWDADVIGIIAAEVLVILLSLAVAIYIQVRKKVFL